MTELRPCPFCGGEAKVLGGFEIIPILDSNGAYIDADMDEGYGYSVQCQSCFALIEEPWLSEDSEEVKKYDGDVAEATYQRVIKRWNNRPTPWHTGTPTETGWYVICFREDGTDDYCVAVWDGKRFIIRDAWDVNIVPTAWQKIDPYKEKQDGCID